MRKELQSVHEKIRSELTPDQRRRFEQLLKNAPRPNPNNPDNGPQPPDRNRDRMRLPNPGERPPDGAPRPPRRDNFPPPDNMPNPGQPEPRPPQDSPQPAPAEPR